MEPLFRNSIWWVPTTGLLLPAGRYRVLELWPELNVVIVFELDRNTPTGRPVRVPFGLFTEGIGNGEILAAEYPIPASKRLGDSELPDLWRKRRDGRYALIRPLVEDRTFLFRLVEKRRSPDVIERAQHLKINPIYLYRSLADYWRYGQTPNALVPLLSNSGSRGKAKTIKKGVRGRPRVQPQFDFSPRAGVAVTDKDKKQIRRAIKKYFLRGKTKTLTLVYKKYLAKYHFAEVELAAAEKRKPSVPSIEQFRYWHKQLSELIKDGQLREGAVSWDMNHRALVSAVSEHVNAPGDRYEIDATIADVFVVSKFNRRRVLGRPVVYVVVDEASRMVVGLFVDLVSASWDAAKQALLNAFLPKKPFCARYGINIADGDWPPQHLPRSLLCDRGEMFHDAPADHLGPMGIELKFAAPLRADWKSVVERRFGIANDEALHDLPGTTRGKPRTRTDVDPKTKALLTLDEVIHILIADFIEFNTTRNIDDLLIPGLVAEDLELTPLNYWNYYTARHLDSLSVVDEAQARAELLRRDVVSVTRRGLKLGPLYYSCEQALQEHWFEQVTVDGQSQLECHVDDADSNRIYVRKNIHSALVACDLLPREDIYANLHKADITWLDEWKREKRETGQDLFGRVKQAADVERLKEEAFSHRKDTAGTFAAAPNNVKNLKEACREERKQRATAAAHDSTADSASDQRASELRLRSQLAFIEEVLDGGD